MGLGINRVQAGAGSGVPEADSAVSSTTSRSKEVLLEGAPCESLNCGGMMVKSEQRSSEVPVGSVPNVEAVVIATRSELGSIKTPLQSAHLLSVVHESRGDRVGSANIVVDDGGVFATAAHKV